jgi:hypothetical protein
MRANERLQNVVKIGYLTTLAKNSQVQPELNPMTIDTTDYSGQESRNNNVAGFWESYLHGLGLVFKFMGKIVLFCIGFWVTYWIWNMIF